MKSIVPTGYAVPKIEIERVTAELRKAHAAELAGASAQERARIEREIARDVQKQIKLRWPWRAVLGRTSSKI